MVPAAASSASVQVNVTPPRHGCEAALPGSSSVWVLSPTQLVAAQLKAQLPSSIPTSARQLHAPAVPNLFDFLDVTVIVAGRAALHRLDAFVVLQQGSDLQHRDGSTPAVSSQQDPAVLRYGHGAVDAALGGVAAGMQPCPHPARATASTACCTPCHASRPAMRCFTPTHSPATIDKGYGKRSGKNATQKKTSGKPNSDFIDR